MKAERGEPHLPIQPRLMRGNDSRRARHIARLPFELIRMPFAAIVTALNDDLRTFSCHHRKEAVTVDESERFENFENRRYRPRPSKVESKQTKHCLQREQGNQGRHRKCQPYEPL